MATVDGLRKRLTRLKQQVSEVEAEISALEGVPKQVTLPGLALPAPARTRSVHEENYDQFQATRREKFTRLGVAFVPDKRHAPMYINVALKAVRDACENDAELFSIFDAYMAEDYPARFDPPYPFSALASQKVWPPLLDRLRGHHEGAH